MSTTETTTEPRTLGDSLDFTAFWHDGVKKDPDAWHKPGECRYCGKEVPAPHVVTSTNGFFSMPITSCEACIVEQLAIQEAEKVKAQEKWFTRFCPPEFASRWNPSIGNERLHTEVFKRLSLSTNRGMVLHGGSGRCKTRIAWEVIKSVETTPPFTGYGWKWYDSYELSIKAIPPDAYTANLIVIDDLGNEPAGTKWETGLLHLLRKRCDFHRPIIITTNLNGKMFKERFFEGAAGAAILRRLGDRCDMIAAE